MDSSHSVGSARVPGASTLSEQTTPADLVGRDLATVGIGSGLVGGAVMAAPLVIWDLMQSGHRALELPMAVTAWLFGLDHFSRVQNLWGPIAVGVVILVVYWALSGLAFTALADRVYGVTRMTSALAAGAAWGFVSFMLFWYMLLPIARGGAPFDSTTAEPRLFVAPTWVWILGFALMGLATGASYAALRRLASPRTAAADELDERHGQLGHAV